MNEITFYKPGYAGSLTRNFDKLFDQLMEENPMWNNRTPLVDVYEEAERYVLEAELPGFSEDQIEIKVEDNLLTLKAEAKKENSRKEKTFLMREIGEKSFARTFTLPRNVDRDQISASFRNGILILELAKVAQAKPKKIEIKKR